MTSAVVVVHSLDHGFRSDCRQAFTKNILRKKPWELDRRKMNITTLKKNGSFRPTVPYIESRLPRSTAVELLWFAT